MKVLRVLRCKLYGHRWEEWEYVSGSSCNRQRICICCYIKQTWTSSRWYREDHTWGKWEYVSETSCTQVRHCNRCSVSENRTASHDYGAWEEDPHRAYLRHRFCGRCHQKDTKNIIEEQYEEKYKRGGYYHRALTRWEVREERRAIEFSYGNFGALSSTEPEDSPVDPQELPDEEYQWLKRNHPEIADNYIPKAEKSNPGTE